MRIYGWIRNNEIFDFSIHGLTKVVEKDVGEYAGKKSSGCRCLGYLEGREKYKGQTHELSTDLVILGKSVDTGNELARELGSPHPHFSAENTEAQGGK